MKNFKIFFLLSLIVLFNSCSSPSIREINIGYIGPLSTRATDLGVAPSKAMLLAVEKYNANKLPSEPTVNLFIEDDQWEKDNAIPLYDKLRKEHKIDVLFISNSDGTVALEEKVQEDNVIVVNPLNNDELLSGLNRNVFKIAKSTEEANGVIGVRLVELGVKKVMIFHFPNDFMTRGANAVKKILDEANISNKLYKAEKENTNFVEELKKCKSEGCDAYVMFGYKNFGYAMKQARELGIKAPFFGSTVLLDPAFYDNSEGAIIGTECTFFTPPDGNYYLANQFLEDYFEKYNERPFSIWPPLQAYDAMNMVLSQVKTVNETKEDESDFGDWLRKKLYRIDYFQGVCGNLSIKEDGASQGIYFSLYRYEAKGKLVKVKR